MLLGRVTVVSHVYLAMRISRFVSAATVKYYLDRYGRLRSIHPQYRLMRELINIHPPTRRHAALQAKYGEWIAHINSLDSTDLVKKYGLFKEEEDF